MFRVLLRLYLITIVTYSAAIFLIPKLVIQLFEHRYLNYNVEQSRGQQGAGIGVGGRAEEGPHIGILDHQPAIEDGQPGMVVVCYDIEKEFVESCFGDDAGLVMTKKWHQHNSNNMIRDVELAMVNAPTLADGSGSENVENS